MRAALVASLLLAPLAAGASPIVVRYAVGTGTPNGMLFCAHVAQVSIAGSVDSASVGGACTIRLGPGASVSIEAIDAARGPVRFFYDLRYDGEIPCLHGWSTSPLLLARPAGCDEVSVAPELGSLAGVVRIT